MARITKKGLKLDNTADGVNARSVGANYSTPSQYTPTEISGEGTDKISAHLNGINTALGTLNPTTTQGDLIIRGSSVLQRLPLGSLGQIPVVYNGTVSYTYSDNPLHYSTIFDDFIANTVTSGENWTQSVNGGGATVTISNTAIDNNSFGIININTGTNNSGRAGISLNTVTYFTGGGSFYYRTRLRIPTLASVAQDYTLEAGLGDSFTADSANGIYFQYERLNSTNWRIETAASSTRTVLNTTVPVVDNTWVVLSFLVNTTGTSVEFFINDVSVGTISTNIPNTITQVCGPFFNIRKSAGTTTRNCLIDYYYSIFVPSVLR